MVPNVVISPPATDNQRKPGHSGRCNIRNSDIRDGHCHLCHQATSSATVEDSNGKVLFHAPVTSGSQHDPLPIGSGR